MPFLFYLKNSIVPPPTTPWTDDFAYGTVTGDPIDETYWTLAGNPYYPDYYTDGSMNYMRMRISSGDGVQKPSAQSKLLIEDDFEIIAWFKAIGGYVADVGGILTAKLASSPNDHFAQLATIVHLNQYYGSYNAGGGPVQNYVDLAGTMNTGGLRITRVGSDWRCYYYTGSAWSQIGPAGPVGTGPVYIYLMLNHWISFNAYTWGWEKIQIPSGTLSWA
jgi:hypothetical protein